VRFAGRNARSVNKRGKMCSASRRVRRWANSTSSSSGGVRLESKLMKINAARRLMPKTPESGLEASKVYGIFRTLSSGSCVNLLLGQFLDIDEVDDGFCNCWSWRATFRRFTVALRRDNRSRVSAKTSEEFRECLIMKA
jgi:hypothetical protein